MKTLSFAQPQLIVQLHHKISPRARLVISLRQLAPRPDLDVRLIVHTCALDILEVFSILLRSRKLIARLFTERFCAQQ